MNEGEGAREGQFDALKRELLEKRERELRLDKYYLSEHDGDTTFSGGDFRRRVTSIEQRLAMTREEIEKEIQAQAIAATFATPQEKATEIGKVGENVTIFTATSTDITPTIPMHN